MACKSFGSSGPIGAPVCTQAELQEAHDAEERELEAMRMEGEQEELAALLDLTPANLSCMACNICIQS